MALEVTPLPVHGEVFKDSRGEDRTFRISWREAEGVFVLSTWRGAECAATFRLSRSELPTFVSAFLEQLTGDSVRPLEPRLYAAAHGYADGH